MQMQPMKKQAVAADGNGGPGATAGIGAVGIQHRPELVPLSEEQVRFEIDMCIGCDRCMRACPVPDVLDGQYRRSQSCHHLG